MKRLQILSYDLSKIQFDNIELMQVTAKNLDYRELQVWIYNNGKIENSVFSSGHRNPQGITNIKGKIFSTEHGPEGGDELNKIERTCRERRQTRETCRFRHFSK